MKRLLTAIFLSALMMSTAFAQCVINQQTIIYLDIERFMVADRMLNVSKERGEAMIMADLAAGNALIAKKGQRLDRVERFNDHISVAKINDAFVVVFNDHVSCR